MSLGGLLIEGGLRGAGGLLGILFGVLGAVLNLWHLNILLNLLDSL